MRSIADSVSEPTSRPIALVWRVLDAAQNHRYFNLMEKGRVTDETLLYDGEILIDVE